MHPPPNVHSYLIRGNREYLNRQKVSTERVRSDERLCKGLNLFHVYIYIYIIERERDARFPVPLGYGKWSLGQDGENSRRTLDLVSAYIAFYQVEKWLVDY